MATRLDARATQTYKAIADHLIADVAELAMEYVAPKYPSAWWIAYAGFTELYPAIDNVDAGLAGACAAGDMELINAMIGRGAKGWNDGLQNACQFGQLKAGQTMLLHGAFACNTCCTWDRCKLVGDLPVMRNPHYQRLLIAAGSASLRYSS